VRDRPPAAYRGQVELIQLMPRLHFIRFPVGHAYLWQDPDGLTHFHPDHIGAAADIADWGDVEVLAHHAAADRP
jgi:Metallo-beta-lactamase superfamily